MGSKNKNRVAVLGGDHVGPGDKVRFLTPKEIKFYDLEPAEKDQELFVKVGGSPFMVTDVVRKTGGHGFIHSEHQGTNFTVSSGLVRVAR